MSNMTPKERDALAALAGINAQYLYQCIAGKRDMDATEASRVERVTDCRIRRWNLRRDWAETWPELKLHPDSPPVRNLESAKA